MPTDSNNAPVKVRMYNIGFGDCFLFYLPASDRYRLMLVDFGQHLSGKKHKLSDIAKDIETEAMAVVGRKRLDVVVATHRHFDHISGFDLKTCDSWEVGEVWMPWTEDPNDPKAVALRNAHFEFGLALASQVSKRSAAYGFIQNSLFPLSNSGAMDTLQRGFSDSPSRRYLPRVKNGRSDRSFSTPVLPKTKIYVLGPSRDPKVIEQLKPPKGEYFKLVANGPSNGSAQGPGIFARKHVQTRAEHRKESPGLHSRPRDTTALRDRAELDPELAAQKLEDVVNGTSLVLAVEINNKVLLLGGDAEWGTWSEILKDGEWQELMRRTALYKVSHHGSYNGTPRRFVEEFMPDNAISLCSLTPMKKWPSIPRSSLMKALEKGPRRLKRTDETPKVDDLVTAIGPNDLWQEITLDR